MPLKKLSFTPGIQHDGSRYASAGGWTDSDKVRFRSGFPEKIGGWQKVTLQTFLGVCRDLQPFTDLTGNYYIGAGASAGGSTGGTSTISGNNISLSVTGSYVTAGGVGSGGNFNATGGTGGTGLTARLLIQTPSQSREQKRVHR